MGQESGTIQDENHFWVLVLNACEAESIEVRKKTIRMWSWQGWNFHQCTSSANQPCSFFSTSLHYLVPWLHLILTAAGAKEKNSAIR
jgi:hypothetical protein